MNSSQAGAVPNQLRNIHHRRKTVKHFTFTKVVGHAPAITFDCEIDR